MQRLIILITLMVMILNDQMLGNCDYAIECGKKLNLKLVGIGGNPLLSYLTQF